MTTTQTLQHFKPDTAHDGFHFGSKPEGKMTGISIYYYKDGRAGRGVYLSMKKEEVEGGRRLTVLDGKGVLTLVAALARKNDQAVAAVAVKLDVIAPELAVLFEATDKAAIISLVQRTLAPAPLPSAVV